MLKILKPFGDRLHYELTDFYIIRVFIYEL